MVTTQALSAETIQLGQRKTRIGMESQPLVCEMTLAEKLDELFDDGYGSDDIFGVVVPLLMQGKVRIDIGDESHRLEIHDKSMICQRSLAIQIFEDYLAARWS